MSTQENLISFVLEEADRQAINAAVETLKLKLLPHLIALTNDEKMRMPKMADKTMAFVIKSYEHAVQNPNLVPPYIDVEEWGKDLDAVETLRQLLAPMDELAKNTDDTMTLAGSEAYQAALAFYNSTKLAAKTNVKGAQTIADDLSIRFDYKKKKKELSKPVKLD